MPAPCRLGGSGALERLHRIMAGRGLPTESADVPSGDGPRDEPGDPQWHRRHRARVALARWEAATPTLYRRAHAHDPRVTAWADRVTDDPASAGALLLTGPTGTGKTHQAYGVLGRIAAAGPASFEMIATNSADMYGSLRPNGSVNGSEHELRRLARVPLLLLDDLGSAKASEWTEEVTYRLIDHRYNHCLPSVLTSNLPARSTDGPDLRTALGERVASRLAEMTTVVPVVGDDRRFKGTA